MAADKRPTPPGTPARESILARIAQSAIQHGIGRVRQPGPRADPNPGEPEQETAPPEHLDLPPGEEALYSRGSPHPEKRQRGLSRLSILMSAPSVEALYSRGKPHPLTSLMRGLICLSL